MQGQLPSACSSGVGWCEDGLCRQGKSLIIIIIIIIFSLNSHSNSIDAHGDVQYNYNKNITKIKVKSSHLPKKCKIKV